MTLSFRAENRKPLRACLQWFSLFLLLTSSGFASAAATADHTSFEVFQQEFDDLQELNAACMSCHTEAPAQLHKTIHWSWLFSSDGRADQGKLRVMNGYHPTVASNIESCDSCHIGFGLDDDFVTEGIPTAEVDCLMCHDTTGEYFYNKFHQDGAKCLACHDDSAENLKDLVKENGSRFTLELNEIAQQVGETNNQSCGSCHFHDGGADGAKHGDLDSSLLTATKALDVHMGSDGAQLVCSDCHEGDDHQMFGSRYQAKSPVDMDGVSALGGARATCVSCHSEDVHEDTRLDQHSDVVACQTCHIPQYARGGIATKTDWDWSTAGEKDRRRKAFVEYDEQGRVTYASQKGHMAYGEDLTPTYRWFDGSIDYAKAGQAVDVETGVMMTEVGGSAKSDRAKISPFHVFKSTLPYDAENQTLIPMQLVGRGREAYWNGYDWKKSLEEGADALDMEFSGEVGFIETQTWWPLNHMVAPAEQALTCASCHEDGLLADVEHVYIPGQTQFEWLDKGAMLILILTLLGVSAHGIARYVFGWHRSRRDEP